MIDKEAAQRMITQAIMGSVKHMKPIVIDGPCEARYGIAFEDAEAIAEATCETIYSDTDWKASGCDKIETTEMKADGCRIDEGLCYEGDYDHDDN